MRPAPDRRRQAPSIDIQVQSPLWKAEPAAATTVRAAIAAAAVMLASPAGEVSVVLTDDSAIAKLNRDWRGIDRPTNVLAFPAQPPKASGGPRMFGDIAIAYETLARECADADKPFLHHLAHLVVHGFLHLMGYDHETDADAAAMEALEGVILARLQVADPYRARPVTSDRHA